MEMHGGGGVVHRDLVHPLGVGGQHEIVTRLPQPVLGTEVMQQQCRGHAHLGCDGPDGGRGESGPPDQLDCGIPDPGFGRQVVEVAAGFYWNA